jgi:hypothetical protein
MTTFNKADFHWDGMYLMYSGDYFGARHYGDDGEKCHPTRLGKRRPVFIARFKYGRKPWKTWVNFICKNFLVEDYLRMAEQTSPLQAMQAKGFVEGKRYR